MPLSAEGVLQAQRAARQLKGANYEMVYCSTLSRSAQTASFFGDPVFVEELSEMDMGAWDGLTWETIRQNYPDLYGARDSDKSLMPPGAENCHEAACRFKQALLKTSGDCIVVSHRGTMGSFFCQECGWPFSRAWDLGLNYGCIIRLVVEEDQVRIFPNQAEIESLYKKYETPEHVMAHCAAVASLADELAQSLIEHGVALNREFLRSAALLHDVYRTQRNHALAGGQAVVDEGFLFTGQAIAKHHNVKQQTEVLDEAALLFFADKLVQGTKRVDIEERFEASLAKCHSPEALEKHDALKQTALKISDTIFRITANRY